MTLATPHQPRHNSLVLVNPSARLGGLLDSRRIAAICGIFYVRQLPLVRPFLWAGHGRSVLARAGHLESRSANPAIVPAHPAWRREAGETRLKETCTMSSISLRAPRAHLSVHPVPEKATTALIKQSKSSNANGIGIPFALRQMSMVDITRYQPIGRQIMITSKSILPRSNKPCSP